MPNGATLRRSIRMASLLACAHACKRAKGNSGRNPNPRVRCAAQRSMGGGTADNPHLGAADSAIMVWIIGQAFVNIGVVLGLLPVLGVPLPLVSAGGSALITTLTAIGVVLSFARHRPVATAPQSPARGRVRDRACERAA